MGYLLFEASKLSQGLADGPGGRVEAVPEFDGGSDLGDLVAGDVGATLATTLPPAPRPIRAVEGTPGATASGGAAPPEFAVEATG